MKLFIYAIAALVVACAVAPSDAKKYDKCSDLPIDIVHDIRQCNEIEFVLYKSNLAEQRCMTASIQLQNSQLATIFLRNEQKDLNTSIKVEISKNMTYWILTYNLGKSSTAHYLISGGNRYGCMYTCTDDQQFIENIFCSVADLGQTKTAMDDQLAKDFPDIDLPFKNGEKLRVVYDQECEKKPRE